MLPEPLLFIHPSEKWHYEEEQANYFPSSRLKALVNVVDTSNIIETWI